MRVAATLLVLSLLGVILLFARLAGWSVDRWLYAVWAIGLVYFGSAYLDLRSIGRLIRARRNTDLDAPRIRGLETRIRDSLEQSASWMSFGTATLVFGTERVFRGGSAYLAIFGAAAFVCCSLLFVRQFRRYIRWRSICLRRKG